MVRDDCLIVYITPKTGVIYNLENNASLSFKISYILPQSKILHTCSDEISTLDLVKGISLSKKIWHMFST